MSLQKTLKLLNCLRSNSRDKLTKISQNTNIPVSSLFDQLKVIESTFIQKHTTLVDFSKLGYALKAQLLISVKNSEKEQLALFLKTQDHINNIYKINDGWNFIVETIHKNIQELDLFTEKLNAQFSIEKMQTHYIIEDVAREKFLSSNY